MYTTSYEFALLSVTLITVAIQFYVVFLVQWKSPKTMADYRYFLNLFTIWDLILSVMMGIFIQPMPITPLTACAIRGIATYFGAYASLIIVSFNIKLFIFKIS